jgi:preprotein translocase subunit SecA
MEICEALSSLHAEGLFSGCLAMTCFSFDGFGHVHIDLNEAVVTSRRIRRLIAEAILRVRKGEELELSLRTDALDSLAFVSPELLFELQQKNATDLACGSKFEVGYASDVWSLACVLLWLLLGEPFTELMWNYLQCFVPMPIDGKDCDSVLYTSWIDKVKASLETKLVSEFVPLQEMLCGCLSTDPGSRPSVIDLWKCIRELIIEPKMDVMVGRVQVINKNKGHCLFLGELCQFQRGSDTMSERQIVNGLQEKNNDSRGNFDQVGEVRVERDLVEGLCGGHVKCIDLKGHLDCITGLTVGGMDLTLCF